MLAYFLKHHQIFDYIDFKCDNSRLVSELSQNCTDTNELNV